MAVLLSVILVLTCTLVHYEVLRWANRYSVTPTLVPRQGRVVVILFTSMASHLVHILLFGLVFFYLREKLDLGGFGGNYGDNLRSFIYFSAETYTSVGYGDIYPKGALRLVSSIETLLGLMLISWSASLSYLEMQRHWSSAQE